MNMALGRTVLRIYSVIYEVYLSPVFVIVFSCSSLFVVKWDLLWVPKAFLPRGTESTEHMMVIKCVYFFFYEVEQQRESQDREAETG